MSDDEPMIINDYARLQKKTLKSGKERYSIKISGDAVIVDADPKALGKGLAEAIATHLKGRIEQISQSVAPNTLRARQTAARNTDKAWVQRRYAGGKIGSMAPAITDRMFNDSGRMAASITAAPTTDGWAVHLAANRLNPETLDGGVSALQMIVQRLGDLVPEFGDANKLGDVISVRKALTDAQKAMFTKVNQNSAELTMKLIESGLQLLKAIG